MTLGAAIKVLLYRYSSQEDIVIGTVTSQRNRPELQGVMGNFLNTLVLRSDLSGSPSFPELLKRVRNVILSAYANQDVPFEKVVEDLHPDRQVSKNPLFQVMFVLQPPLSEDKLGWRVSQLEVDSGTSKFDLTFNLEERSEGTIGAIEYNTDLFDATTIDRAIGYLSALLEGIVTNPNQSISELPLLTEKERHQLLVEWNDTATDYPKDKCIHPAFVLLEAMTPNGKVDRRALPAPDPSSLVNQTSFLAPRDSLELQLAQIWSEVLGVSPIGVRDNFFDLGGHSLLAVRLMAEIEKQFGSGCL